MKKLYIYLLVGFISFFGFSMGVEASNELYDSLPSICTYNEKIVDGYKYKSEIRYINTGADEIFYGIVYKINNSTGEIAEEKYNEWRKSFKYSAGDYKLKTSGNNVYSFADINKNTCPKNVTFNIGASGVRFCYANNESDCTNVTSGSFWNKKISLSNGANNKIDENPASCVIPVELYCEKGQSCVDKGSCYIKFEKAANNRLHISAAWENTSKFDPVGDDATVFTCNGNNADHKYTFLNNLTASKDNVIKTRPEFDKEFIEEWDKNGSCEGLIYPGYNARKENILLLPKAKEELAKIEAAGGDTGLVDSGTFAERLPLEEWKNYGWQHWYDNGDGPDTCEGLLGEEIIEIINDILLYVRILVPILLIGLGVADFIKAMIATEEGAMKKAQNKFLKRLIVAAVIFLIPSLTNLLFNLINGVWAHINNGACNIWN